MPNFTKRLLRFDSVKTMSRVVMWILLENAVITYPRHLFAARIVPTRRVLSSYSYSVHLRSDSCFIVGRPCHESENRKVSERDTQPPEQLRSFQSTIYPSNR